MNLRIKKLREKNNFSIEEISEKLEIDTNIYLDYENGKKLPPINILSKLARIYNTSIDYIVGITDNPICHPKNY